MHYAIFEDGLSEGEHTLRIRVSERRDVQSLGNKIKITGFIVGEKTE